MKAIKKIELEIAQKLILAPLIRARVMSHDYYVQLISRLLARIFSRQMWECHQLQRCKVTENTFQLSY